MSRQHLEELTFATDGRGLYEITADVRHWLDSQRPKPECGLLTLYIRHTSASLTIQENADPDVMHDLDAFFSRLVKDDPTLYRHTAEGADDMPAHIRAALTATHLAIPVQHGRMMLGTWQGVFLFEHRYRPHQRHVAMHFFGD